jgi:hypothetical protein
MRQLSVWVRVATVLAVLGGCSDQQAPRYAAAQGDRAEVQMMAANAPMERQPDNTLAYEHNVNIETPVEKLAARVEAVRAACNADKASGCTLLEISNLLVNEVPQGSVRLRVAPGSVNTLIQLASEGGRVVNSRTYAEDLAQPMADTDRQLSLLNLHRQRLTEFMSRKDIGIEQLITVSKELASVQAQIEQFDSQRANLRRRVDTELLTLNWSAPVSAYQSAQTPVMDALKSFGSNFRDAIAQVLIFLAYVLPWLVILVPGLILVRWLWRWVSAWLQRKKTPIVPATDYSR